MKRFVVAALAAGLWASAAQAQQGPYASTVPAVPMPIVTNGEVQDPTGRAGPRLGGRVFAATRWAPVGEPSANALPMPTQYAPGAGYGYPVPPPPAGAGGLDGRCGSGACGSGGCASSSRGLSWDRVKSWLCFHQTPTNIPKCIPTPYSPPLQGMFPCSGTWAPACGADPGYGYGQPPAPGYSYPPAYPPGGPQYPTGPVNPMQPPIAPMVPAPGAPPPHVPGTMPPRGVQGPAVAPTWQGRAQPAAVSPGIAGYHYAAPTAAARPMSGPVVTTGYYPQK